MTDTTPLEQGFRVEFATLLCIGLCCFAVRDKEHNVELFVAGNTLEENMKILSKVKKIVCDPKIRFGYLSKLGFYNWMPDRQYLIKEWSIYNKGKLDLENPKTFNEKLQWLKLHDRKTEYARMVDKAAAKDYVAEKIGEEYVIPTLGVWNSFDEIDFDKLPNQFVLKCTHDSGGLAICRDKSKWDKQKARKTIEASLKTKYFYRHREWPYKDLKPRILAEKYMQEDGKQDLTDYKFFCFNGKPRFLYVSAGLEDHETAQISFLNLDWSPAAFKRKDYRVFEVLPEKPKNWEKMLKISEILSKGIPFLRVDLYEIKGRVYFGELTFTPCAGMIPFDPPSADMDIGKMLDISGVLG